MTTRFLYMTDTHWGAMPGAGYMVQPRDPAKFDAVHQGVKQWLAKQNPPIDFVMHGGDVVNDGTEDQIIGAMGRLGEIQALGPRVFVCLGNHDLEQRDSLAIWREHHGGTLPDASGSYAVTFEDFHLYVLTHHWHSVDPPLFWDRSLPQTPVLDDIQCENFETFAASSDRPIVLVVHAPVQGILPSQSGQPKELHAPDPSWRAYILGVIDRYPAVQLLLTGHAHVHTLARHKQCVIAGTSALFETPYEARLITVDGQHMTIETLSFGELFGIEGAYRNEYAYAQGQAGHRTARWSPEL